MIYYTIIGRNIRTAREQTRMTQTEAAKKLKISVCYYGKLERGDVKQSLDRLAEISILFSVPIESLLSGAFPHMQYANRPATDGSEQHMAQILCGCNKQRRDLILYMCEAIAQLK